MAQNTSFVLSTQVVNSSPCTLPLTCLAGAKIEEGGGGTENSNLFPLPPNPLPFSTPATPQAAQTYFTLFPCNESLGQLWLCRQAIFFSCSLFSLQATR